MGRIGHRLCRHQAKSGLHANELTAWTGGHLAGYKKPRRVEFLDALPLGSTNKVLKTELRRRLWQGRARGIN